MGTFDFALFGFIFSLVSFLDDDEGLDLSGRILILFPSSSVSKYFLGGSPPNYVGVFYEFLLKPLFAACGVTSEPMLIRPPVALVAPVESVPISILGFISDAS